MILFPIQTKWNTSLYKMYKCLSMNTQVFINKCDDIMKMSSDDSSKTRILSSAPSINIPTVNHNNRRKSLAWSLSLLPVSGLCVGTLCCMPKTILSPKFKLDERPPQHNSWRSCCVTGRVSFGYHRPRCFSRAKVHVSLCSNRSWFQDTGGRSRESDISFFFLSAG